MSGIAGCPDAYQSEFGSGFTFGAGYAATSVAFGCDSAADATQEFAVDEAFQHSYFDRSGWHYRPLHRFTFGDMHVAWLNDGWAGHGLYTLSLLFVRDRFIVMLQVSYQGMTRAAAGKITKRLAAIMSRRIAAAEG